MAEMGLGYGSEYQLLRYLGHHRQELNKTIKENTRLKGELFWLDFPKNRENLSLDGEYKGVDFFKDGIEKEKLENLKYNWSKYWSSTGNSQNWDGVILHKDGNKEEWVIVEAKAHLKEIESHTKSATNQNIQKAFTDTKERFNIISDNWFGKYYQLANRLAFINFLLDNNISASLLYVYFINGYDKRQLIDGIKTNVENKSVKTQKEWEEIIEKEYICLGISDKAKQYISNIFIDCV